MNFYAIVLFVVTVTLYTVHTDATVCAPFSTFKIDCDYCRCSQNGREYTCTSTKCDTPTFLNKNNKKDVSDNSIPGGEYPREASEDGPSYLNDAVPSSEEVDRVGRDYVVVDGGEPNNQYARDADEVVPPYPYINDEIPSSQENNRIGRDYVVVDGGEPSNQYARDADDPYVNDEMPSSQEYNRVVRDYVVVDGGEPNNQYARDAEEVVPPYPYLNDEIPSSQEDNRVGREYVVVDNIDNGGGPNYQYRRDADDVAYVVPQDYRRRRDLGLYL